jgi:hypothetical protein
VKGLELAAGADGWVELVTNGAKAFFGDVELTPRATLLVGDSLCIVRSGAPALRILAG